MCGTSFDLSDGFGNADRWRQLGKDVYMVFHAVHGVQLPAELSQDPSEVGEKARLEISVNKRSPVFRRVDNVGQEVAIAVRHGSSAMRSPGGILPRNLSVARLSGLAIFGDASD